MNFRGRPVKLVDIAAVCQLYDTGQTVRQVAEYFGISVGKTFNILRKNGRKRKRNEYPPPSTYLTQDGRERLSAAHRGERWTAERKRKLSESLKSHYNGLNGYGYTKKHNSGYIIAYVPDHPNASKDGTVMLHTIIMEQALGRYLRSDEVVHHINHIKDDNRLENLQLMNRREHQSMHMKERRANERKERRDCY